MNHHPGGGVLGPARDMEIQVEEILKSKRRLEEILAHHTGKNSGDIAKATDRDNFLSPQESKDFGLIDHIVDTRAEKKAPPPQKGIE
jgi:ATP-dependent Clp protease protease subunit